MREAQYSLTLQLESKINEKQNVLSMLIQILNQTLVYQKQARRYQELRDKKYKFVCSDVNERQLLVQQAFEKFDNVKGLISTVASQSGTIVLKDNTQSLELFADSTLRSITSA